MSDEDSCSEGACVGVGVGVILEETKVVYSPFERNLIPYLALDRLRQAEVVGSTGEGFRSNLMEVAGVCGGTT